MAITWPRSRPKACCARGWARSTCRPCLTGSASSHNGVTLSLHPAGHVLGSAQVRLEHGGQVWVASGDYKVAPDRTCAPFEPVRCDVFITESTFGLPIYRWCADDEIFADINGWWGRNVVAGARQRAHLLQLRQGAAHPGRRGPVDRADHRARRGGAAQPGLPRRRRRAAANAHGDRGQGQGRPASARWCSARPAPPPAPGCGASATPAPPSPAAGCRCAARAGAAAGTAASCCPTMPTGPASERHRRHRRAARSSSRTAACR